MSNSGLGTSNSKRLRQACLNCRRKKVKCHGEQPSCSFCARLLQKCVYPRRAWSMTEQMSAFRGSEIENGNYAHLASRVTFIESQMGRNDISSPRANTSEWVLPPEWQFPTGDLRLPPMGQPFYTQTEGYAVRESIALPSTQVLRSTVDLYFELCHNQPYCFFHEETFRSEMARDQLPQYLIMAVLAMSRRFSHDVFYGNNELHTSERYAAKAWTEVVKQVFESDNSPNHRLVQAATLLAIYDFTACKHRTAWIKIGVAVSLAQALRMMTEPSPTLPFSTQEELRRTLWSVFLLDKMATCGRDRPSLFLDRTIDLQLPCSEYSFITSTHEKVVTLKDLPSLDDPEMENLKSFAPSVALVSILSETASYAFEHSKIANQKSPWDHQSEYQSICSRLARFETFFDGYGNMQDHILNNELTPDGTNKSVAESDIFAYILYNLCYCLLHHPFLLRRRLEKCGTRAPVSFLAQSLKSGLSHAQALTSTLTNAKHARYRVSATFFSYGSLVAGSIHSLFQHSPDAAVSLKSQQALQESLAHITEKARYWQSSNRMARALSQFSGDSARYSFLIKSSPQSVLLSLEDIEKLYALCDYGTMSMPPSESPFDVDATTTGSPEGVLATVTQERSPTTTYEQYGGHIDGIISQIFGHDNTSAMMDNFYCALGGSSGPNDTTTT